MSRKISGDDELVFRKEFGRRLKALRGRTGLTQTEFATKISLQLLAVQRYEAGQRLPDVYLLRRIATEFGCNLHWLICGVGSEER